jgi:hypothetical protein
MEKYRIESGHIYEYDKARKAYLHCGRILPGEKKSQALKRVKEIQKEYE